MILFRPFPKPFTADRPITPEEIKREARKGYNRAEIAKALGVSYRQLCKAIEAKFSCYKAEKEGQVEFAAGVLNAAHVKEAA